MRKIQVPAYAPLLDGVHAVENIGVWKDSKKVIAMSDMDIDMPAISPDAIPVEVAMAMAVLVAWCMSMVAVYRFCNLAVLLRD